MIYKTLQLAFDSAVATIALNRPDKRNAISYELIDDLISALDEVRNSSVGILILTGAGKAFCSGMDLDNLKALIGRTHEQNLEDSRTRVNLFRSLYEFPKRKGLSGETNDLDILSYLREFLWTSPAVDEGNRHWDGSGCSAKSRGHPHIGPPHREADAVRPISIDTPSPLSC